MSTCAEYMLSDSRSLQFTNKTSAESSCNASGWDELVDIYTTNKESLCVSSSTRRSDTKQRYCRSTDINLQDNIVKALLDSSCIQGNQTVCPICSYTILNKSPHTYEDVAKLLIHMSNHEGKMDSSLKIPCALCFKFYKKSCMDKHLKQAHGSLEDNKVREVIYFTNSVQRYQSIFNTFTLSKDCTANGAATCSDTDNCSSSGCTFQKLPQMEFLENSKPLSKCTVMRQLAIRKKFMWSGPPPPPLSVTEEEQLSKLYRNKCPFCKSVSGGRSVRVSQSCTYEMKEECMIAHIVRYHHKDPTAVLILNTTRYRISTDERSNPLKFLLHPTKEGMLLCSSCETAAFSRMANLRNHWAICATVSKHCINEQRGELCPTCSTLSARRIRLRGMSQRFLKCPLPPCNRELRRFKNATDSVRQLLHVIKSHFLEENAIQWISHWADEFGSVMASEAVFKFDVMKSLKYSLEMGLAHMSCLSCGKMFKYSRFVSHRKRCMRNDAN